MFIHVFNQSLNEFMVTGHYKVEIKQVNPENDAAFRGHNMSRLHQRAILKQVTIHIPFSEGVYELLSIHEVHLSMRHNQDGAIIFQYIKIQLLAREQFNGRDLICQVTDQRSVDIAENRKLFDKHHHLNFQEESVVETVEQLIVLNRRIQKFLIP
jgi:hypothetical protein